MVWWCGVVGCGVGVLWVPNMVFGAFFLGGVVCGVCLCAVF